MPLSPHPRPEQAEIARRLAELRAELRADQPRSIEPSPAAFAGTDAAPAMAGWRARLVAVPGLGALLRYLRALQKLGSFRAESLARMAALEARAAALEAHATALGAHAAALETHAAALEAHAASLEVRSAAQQHLGAASQADISALQIYVGELHADLEGLGALTRATAAAQADLSQPLTGDARPGDAGLPEAVYTALEERFRGDRADIAARQAVYLPHIEAACRQSGLPVVDIGCGRGEWLECLKGRGIAARGVDVSAAMVALCRDRGLAATAGDALFYIAGVPPGSLGAVTAVHVVDHLASGALWQLLCAAWRALAPGGTLILETPNPENLQVAAYSFRMDPSHVEPLPPPLLDFLIDQAGFEKVTLLRHAPWPELAMDDGAYPPYLRQLLFCGQDYAIVAKRREHASVP